MYIIGALEGRERERIFEEIMAGDFPKLRKKMNNKIQEAIMKFKWNEPKEADTPRDTL